MPLTLPAFGVINMPTKKSPKNICRIPLMPREQILTKEVPRLSDVTWRIFRIMAEFVEGFQFLSETSREVTIFGSARFSSDDRWYKEAVKLGRLLAKNKFTVITGGGPGIMEAGNKGAVQGGGESIGLNIQLPTEQRTNPFVKTGRGFHYFFTRKVMMAASAQAYVFFPGGFGTLDEFLEMVVLIQTGKAQKVPIVCVGHEFWDPFFTWIKKIVCEQFNAVTNKDLKLYRVVETAEEAFALIKNSKERSFF